MVGVTTENTRSQLKSNTGFIFILDALGASTFDKKRIESFIEARKVINDLISDVIKSSGNNDAIKFCEIFTFGDTVLVAVALKTEKDIGGSFVIPVTSMQQYMLMSLISSKILYRGAFSVGEFFVDGESNTVMGPAVSDAAAWYESANLPALIATPKTRYFIEFHYQRSKLKESFPLFHEYNVPMRDGKRKDMYLVPWLSGLYGESFQKHQFGSVLPDVDKFFKGILQLLDIPKGTEEKYENLVDYFEFTKDNRGLDIIHDSPESGNEADQALATPKAP